MSLSYKALLAIQANDFFFDNHLFQLTTSGEGKIEPGFSL